jgi:imidazolonepropionase-like amidohydrolase
LEEASAIVETAHARGIPVTVHATESEAIERALDAGVDDIAHMATDRLSDALIHRMADQGVGWVPTLKAVRIGSTTNLQRFLAVGGRVALGNDAGFLEGLVVGMPMPEICAMQEAGMSPMQIIVAATQDAAHVCRRSELLGTLQVGRIADVLVVKGDPLQDLEVLTDVQLVVHGGVIIRDER